MADIQLIHGDCMEKARRTFRNGDSRSAKISNALRRGSYFECEQCSSKFWRKPSEIKKGNCRFCSKNCYLRWQKGVSKISGFKLRPLKKEKNPNWKGGITKENILIRNGTKTKAWRNDVFLRDGYMCQRCFNKCGNGHDVFLHAHHIKPFSKNIALRFDVNNGLTLCKKCHYKEHSNAKH